MAQNLNRFSNANDCSATMSLLSTILSVVGVVVLAYIIDARIFAPRRGAKLVAELQERAKTMDPRALENPAYGTIECGGDSLAIITKEGRYGIRWADIEELHAFKRDILTVDLICLAFKRAGKEEYLEVHEEMSGYRDMLKVLPERLPGYSEAWFGEVAFPAFATNHRVIWKSSHGTDAASTQATKTGGGG